MPGLRFKSYDSNFKRLHALVLEVLAHACRQALRQRFGAGRAGRQQREGAVAASDSDALEN